MSKLSKKPSKKAAKRKSPSSSKTEKKAKKVESEKLSIKNTGQVIKKLFGTDGIRGQAGVFPVTPDVILKVGQALGHILTKDKKKKEITKVVIGKDTRISGYMVEQALASGLNSVGVHVQLIGPLPTPGIGFLAQNMRADAGIIISASHNQFHDNGIKIFGADGFKISDKIESEIEKLVFSGEIDSLLLTGDKIGRTKRIDDAAGRYIVYAKNTFPLDLTLDGLRIVLDCANGASYKVAPMIFEELGAEVFVLSNSPDGFNINKDAGAMHPEKLSDAVKTYRADIGIALDGDADRLIVVDEKGRVVDGDCILALCALHMKKTKSLSKNAVVATTMSNLALDELMKDNDIEVFRSDVGDKNVVKEMRKKGYNLGGEQSGHIVFLDHSTTGDGVVAALKVLEVSMQRGQKISELSEVLKPYPQILKNVKVKKKTPVESIKGYKELYDYQSTKLGKSGRILIRFSGTEPLIRILVEGKDLKLIGEVADQFEAFFKTNLF